MSDLSSITTFLLYLGIVVLMFLVFRELVCWYWKINRGIEVLVEIRDLLRMQALASAPRSAEPAHAAPEPAAPPSSPPPEARCAACAAPIQPGALRCARCGLDVAAGP